MNSKIILVRLHWALLQSLVYALPERKRLFRDLTHLVKQTCLVASLKHNLWLLGLLYP